MEIDPLHLRLYLFYSWEEFFYFDRCIVSWLVMWIWNCFSLLLTGWLLSFCSLPSSVCFFVQISLCSLGRHSDLSRLVAFVLFLRCDARQPKTGYPQLLFYSFRFWIFLYHGFSWLYSRLSSQPMGVLGFLCTGSVWAVLTLCLMSVISCSRTWWPSAFLGGENWNMCIFSIIQLKGFFGIHLSGLVLCSTWDRF